MYRQYEDPYKLEKQLEDAKRRLTEAQEMGEETDWLWEEVAELKDRVNFAWQDDEYDQFWA